MLGLYLFLERKKNRAKVAHCTLHIALDTASDTALQTVQDCNTKKVKYFEEPIMRNNERGKKITKNGRSTNAVVLWVAFKAPIHLICAIQNNTIGSKINGTNGTRKLVLEV